MPIFCKMCVRIWFETKKSCPVCRADMKLKVVCSVVLDSLVDDPLAVKSMVYRAGDAAENNVS